MISRKINAQRADAATPEQVCEFLERLERTRQRLNIPLEAVYNIDETSVALGVCLNATVVASSLKKKANVKSTKDRE
jgi:hypothetical protein